MVNPDFRDLFAALNEAQANYLVVGAHAVAFYAEPRFTKDLDVWVEASPLNAPRILAALHSFGAPLAGVTEGDFVVSGAVLRSGVAQPAFNRLWRPVDLGHRPGGVDAEQDGRGPAPGPSRSGDAREARLTQPSEGDRASIPPTLADFGLAKQVVARPTPGAVPARRPIGQPGPADGFVAFGLVQG